VARNSNSQLSPSVSAPGWLVAAFLLLPLLVVFPVSLTDQSFLALPKETVSLEHFRRLFKSADWLSSAGQSFTIAAVSACLAVIFGTLAALGCWRSRSKVVPLIQVVMVLPLIVPPLVYALGYYRLLLKVGMLDTFSGVVLAHAVTSIPYVFITVTASLAGFDRRLELAAKSMGATTSQALRRVVLPNILPGLLSGAILSFVHSWDEIVIVLFIASRNVYTLPRRIWDGVRYDLDPMMAAAAAVLIGLSIVLLVVNLLTRSNGSLSKS
jgi:putative spermidine/putrescine transport system permease protein